MVAALTLVCGVFAFTGCADYESDINSLNDRLDALETGQIADLEEQIATLTGALDEAKNAITALEGSVSDLEAAKEDLQSQIDDLNTRIEENDGDIADLISQVAELEAELARIDGLESDLENLKATVEDIENNYLTKTEAQNTYATLEAVNDLEDALSSIEGRVDNIETVELPTVKAAIEKAQENQRKFNWYLKMDVRKYFDSIDHRILMNLLARRFKDAMLLRLFSKLIDSYSVTTGKGLPMGNLSSQYFANHYLAVADHYLKEKLKVKAVIR